MLLILELVEGLLLIDELEIEELLELLWMKVLPLTVDAAIVAIKRIPSSKKGSTTIPTRRIIEEANSYNVSPCNTPLSDKHLMKSLISLKS